MKETLNDAVDHIVDRTTLLPANDPSGKHLLQFATAFRDDDFLGAQVAANRAYDEANASWIKEQWRESDDQAGTPASLKIPAPRLTTAIPPAYIIALDALDAAGIKLCSPSRASAYRRLPA